jgi:thiamine-monophosphate kinase
MTEAGRSGEFERIARLTSIYGKSYPASVALGIGDDCAVLHASQSARVWTVDAAVEGVHFDRHFMRLEDIGYRAFMAAASDVAAMGALADCALSALILPASLGDAELWELAKGTAEAAEHCACSVAGGNLTRGAQLSITTSVLGHVPTRAVTRAGACAGDGVYITGVVGAAALGLRLLQQGSGHAADAPFLQHFLRPKARFDCAGLLAAVASASIDVSDGLAQDLGHVARASQVDLLLELSRIPREEGFAEAAARAGAVPEALLLAGGEDYELAFTAAPECVPTELATRIGTVALGSGRVLVQGPDGAALPWQPGFDHFRAP